MRYSYSNKVVGKHIIPYTKKGINTSFSQVMPSEDGRGSGSGSGRERGGGESFWMRDAASGSLHTPLLDELGPVVGVGGDVGSESTTGKGGGIFDSELFLFYGPNSCMLMSVFLVRAFIILSFIV